MDSNDDPYEILGLTPSATVSQIKTAYRKAALRSHPDKQRTEADRERATIEFSKISNAYELLSDPEERERYDQRQLQQQRSGMFPEDNFASFHHRFHDPFQLFEHVFRQEFGSPSASYSRPAYQRDPFFGDDFMSPFDRSPMLGGGSLFDSFFADPFAGRHGRTSTRRRDPFEPMRRMQQDMMDQFQSLDHKGNRPDGSTRTYYSSSSNTTMGGGAPGESVTTRTTTQIVNGRQQTVTERVVHKADGTVERHVDRSGDEDFAALGGDAPFIHGYLERNGQQGQDEEKRSDTPSTPDKFPNKRGWFRR